MSRRILVRVGRDGSLSVEADGFQGKGCEAATRAIEQALGSPVNRVLKPEHRQAAVQQRTQTLGQNDE